MDMLHVHMTSSLQKQTNLIKNDTELPKSILTNEAGVVRNSIYELIFCAKKHNQDAVKNLKSAGLLMEVAI